jgi:hypothetical protein
MESMRQRRKGRTQKIITHRINVVVYATACTADDVKRMLADNGVNECVTYPDVDLRRANGMGAKSMIMSKTLLSD